MVKKRVSPKKKVHLFFGQFRFSSLLLHDITRRFRRVCTKNPIKIGFFGHSLLLDAEETERQKRKKERGQKKR